MKAVVITGDKHLVWTDVPNPVRQPGEILIDIKAAGLNRADLMQREGNYPPPAGWPTWPGLECSGIVREADATSRFHTGDKVCALLGGGGYAQQVTVPEGMVMTIPEGLSFIEAASLPETFATAFLNLRMVAGMKAGDKVFIQAGASGLGISAIQLAKACGAIVMTTVGAQDKAEFVKSIGADVIVNRKTDSILDAVKAFAPDIALDPVAGKDLGKYVVEMAHGGRWIVLATLAGPMTEINMIAFFRKGVHLIGSTLRSRTPEAKAQVLSSLENEYWKKFASGEIKPVIYKTFSMKDAEAAHAVLENTQNIGKVVLEVN